MVNRTLRGLDKLRIDVAQRTQRFVTPPVISLGEAGGRWGVSPAVPPPGTLVVYYARQGGTLLAELTRALQAGDSRRINRIGRDIETRGAANPAYSSAQVLRALPGLPCLFEVRFARKTLNSSAGLLPDIDFGSLTFSFVGEELPDDFQVVEHLSTPDALGYDYAVVVHAPRLTELERGVLTLDTSALELAIGPLLADDTFKEVADVVKKAAEDAVKEKHAKTAGCRTDLLGQLEEVVRRGEISPTAAVQQLIRARTELISRSLP